MRTEIDFSSENIQKWLSDIAEVAGVHKVTFDVVPITEYRAVYPNTPGNSQYYTDTDHYVEIGIVAGKAATQLVFNYAAENIPGIDNGSGAVSITNICPDFWYEINDVVGAQDIMDYYLSTPALEFAAERTHQEWRLKKDVDRTDPNHAYIGYGEKRLKVGDLNSDERKALMLPIQATDDQDVYHPLDVPYDHLDDRAKDSNIVPMSSVCLTIADFMLQPETSLDELTQRLRALSEGADKVGQRQIDIVTHAAWMARDIASGGRPWSPGSRANYHSYTRLSPEVQSLDTDASRTPINVLNRQLYPVNKAQWTMQYVLTREGGPYEKWFADEIAVLKAAQGWNTTSSSDRVVVPLKDDPQPEVTSYCPVPSFAQEATSFFQSVTHSPGYSKDGFEDRLPEVAERSLRRRHIRYDPLSHEWTITDAGRSRFEDLELVDRAMRTYSFDALQMLVNNYARLKSRYMLS